MLEVGSHRFPHGEATAAELLAWVLHATSVTAGDAPKSPTFCSTHSAVQKSVGRLLKWRGAIWAGCIHCRPVRGVRL